MKLFFKIFFSIIGFVLLIAIGIAVYVGVMVYDTTDHSNKEILDNPKTTQELMNSYTTEALSETKTNSTVSYLLDEYEMNYLLQSISNSIDIPYVKVKSIYSIYNEDGTVSIEGPVKCFGFSSCLKGDLYMEESNGTFTITMKKVSIGRFGSDSFMIKTFVIGNVDFKDAITELQKKGIYLDMKMVNNELVITITKTDISSMLASLSDQKYKELYLALTEQFVGKNDLLSFQFNEASKIGFLLYLNEMKNSNVLPYDLEAGTKNLQTLQKNVEALVLDGIVTYKNVNLVYDFLVRGYDKLSEQDQATIKALNLTSIGVMDNRSYKGIIERSETTIVDAIGDNLTGDLLSVGAQILLDGYYKVYISAETLNEMLNSLDFIGTSFAFTDGTNVSYITITSLFTTMQDNQLDLHLILDFNGTSVSFDASFLSNESQTTSITMTLKEMKLGNVLVDEKAKTHLLAFLESFTNSLEFMKINAENETINFDFTKYFETDNAVLNLLVEKGLDNKSTSISNEKGGSLVVKFYK